MKMKALVINLEVERVRMAFQQEQAKKFDLELQRIPAVIAEAVTPPADDKAWRRWQRVLRRVEMATLLSHKVAWNVVSGGTEPKLILEDDAWLMPQAQRLLEQCAADGSGLEYVSLETRGRRKIIGSRNRTLPALRRLWLDRSGAAAYVLWPAGARKLLQRAEAVPALADAVINETPSLERWQAVPAMAIQMDMASRYDLVAPILSNSSISSAPLPTTQGAGFGFRRVTGQVAMATKFLQLALGAVRVEVLPRTGRSV